MSRIEMHDVKFTKNKEFFKKNMDRNSEIIESEEKSMLLKIRSLVP